MGDASRAVFTKRLRDMRQEYQMTVREVADAIGVSEATVSRYENGLVEPKRATIMMLAKLFEVNSVWLTGCVNAPKYVEGKKLNAKRVPIVGQIAAGPALLAEQNIEGYFMVDEAVDVQFGLRVRGDSMIGARILDGDIVFVHTQPTVDNGEIAVVMVDNEATLKRFYRLEGSALLRSENPAYKDIVINRKDKRDVRVIGKAIFFWSEVH